MHETFTQVLTNKDLSKAGDLFNVADTVIVNDLTNVVLKIKEIASLPDYTRNDNDQSIVEICITRVTSAIRETQSIERHAMALVALLHTCLNHNLRPTSRGQDPPHAKIASDVLSCIFLNYQKKQVMELALPVAVKFLHKGNKELSRNMTSYLSLAAIDAADLLALHVQPILDSIISGNYSLSRVLVQIYSVQKEHIHDHVMTLVSLLPQCETNDKLGLLTLFSLVAKYKSSLLEASLPQLVDCMISNETSLATLQIFVELSSKHPAPFTEYIGKLKLVVEEQPQCLPSALQIIGCVGRLNKERAKYAVEYISQNLIKIDTPHLGPVIRELQILCNRYPALLTENLLSIINKYSDRVNSATRDCIQQLNNEFTEIRNTNVNQTPGVTIVRVNGNRENAPSRSELSLGGFFAPHVHAGKTHSKYQKHSDTSKSTGRLVTSSNRSMPRLNHFPHSTGRLGSQSNQLNRPTRLGSSHSSIIHHSITVLNPPSRPLSGQIPPSSVLGSHLSGSSVATKMAMLFPQPPPAANSGISSLPGTISPTKSTSSSIATLREIQEQIDRYKKDSVPSDISFGPPPLSFPHMSNKDLASGLKHSTLPPLSMNSVHPMASSATLPPGQGTLGGRSKNSSTKDNNSSSFPHQRISVFEPVVMRDTVQHFCEKHLDKIKAYMQKIFVRLPLPVRCGIEEKKNRKIAKLYFACQGKGDYCLYDKQLFIMKTRHPRIYIHLMFLALQARSDAALSTKELQVSSLKNCWDILKCEHRTFITLVTSAFPSTKDMDLLMHELRNERFFDVFEYNGIEKQWGCFLCNHPDRARGFVEENTPVIEGQLKEKKSKWKIFRKWRTRYFTLSGGQLSYRSEDMHSHDEKTDDGGIEVHLIRSVKVNRNRHIPKAFEIFTEDKSFVLKAKDSSNAEEWVRCLSIAVAHSQTRENDHGTGRNTHTSIPRNFMYGHKNIAGSTHI